MPLDDPETVRTQYASEDNLRARQRMYAEVSGPHPHEVLWQTLVEWEPRRALEVGGGPGELAERMQKELGAQVSFIDSSSRMVELARERGVAIAAWMLYHVPDLDRGLAELARVLRPGGALIAVTNSILHLSEFRDLISYPDVLRETFNRENGKELLEQHFAQVERLDLELEVTVRDRQALVDYQQSTSVPTQPVPEHVELPFITHSRVTIFVAMT